VWLDQDGSGHDNALELFEGCLLLLGPSSCLSFLGDLMEGLGHMQEVLDNASVLAGALGVWDLTRIPWDLKGFGLWLQLMHCAYLPTLSKYFK